MNEITMIWFLQKTTHYQLSKEAMELWMDFYSYLQNQSRACTPQVPFSQLKQISDLPDNLFWEACQELKQAEMLQFAVQDDTLLCRLVSGKLYPLSCKKAV